MSFKDSFRRTVALEMEPRVLFPSIALILLLVIWGTTLMTLKVRYSDAKHAAVISSRELLDTYEAQVVRAMGEIDQAMESWPERATAPHPLSDLKDKGLLPPDLIFTVSIADAKGALVESTHPIERQDLAAQDAFRRQRWRRVLR